MSKKPPSIPGTLFGRATKLLGTGAKLIGKEVALRASQSIGQSDAAQILKTRVQQTENLVKTLGQLKGAAMKAGQLLGIEGSDLLPPEVVKVLRTLHDDSTFLPIEDIRRILLKELGPQKFGELKDLSSEPVASASIGQVHTAYLQDRKVAIKIQFPGVAESIDADLSLVKKLTKGFLVASQRKVDIEPIFDQLAVHLKQEVDYIKEAEAGRRYREGFATKKAFIIPEVYPSHSTTRVLVSSFEEGMKINDWLSTTITKEDAQHFTHLILDMICTEFFDLGLVQTDPNFGNFLYRPDSKELVILDFGAAYEYSESFRSQYLKLGALCERGETEPILRHMAEMQIFDPREGPGAREAVLRMLERIIQIFLPEHQPFDFASQEFLREIRADVMSLVAQTEYTPPQRELLFLNRKLGGMFHLLKDLKAQIDLHHYWRRVFKLGE